MSVVCPTVTAEDLHTYRAQLERVEQFASRIHLDFMDGEFAPNLSVPLDRIWLPKRQQVDIHLMYKNPEDYVQQLLTLRPDMVIVHAEADGQYERFAKQLHDANIRVGVCLLQSTPVSLIASHLPIIDHVLVFSGDLGHFGGTADLQLLDKVRDLKNQKASLEIGWDGGINAGNARSLAEAGVDVLNVGGFIQRAEDPKGRFEQLVSLLG